MNNLTQNNNFLIGSEEAINELACKPTARILCVSDSHGNSIVFKNIIEKIGSDCNALVFCGDGASDIAALIDFAGQDSDFREKLPAVIAFVQGNCDPSSFPIFSENFTGIVNNENSITKRQILIPPRQILTAANKKIMIVHGNNQGIEWGMEKLAQETQFSECQISLYGHSHIAKENRFNEFRFINPGSCSRPRGGLPPSCAILTITEDFIDTAFIKIDRNGGTSTFTPLA